MASVTRGRLAAAAVSMALLLSACTSSSQSSASERLPAVSLPTLAGDELVDMADLPGPAVVNLWATWCAPCRRELPDFEEVYRELGDDVAFWGVNLGDRAVDAQAFVSEIGVTFPQLLDEDGTFNERLGTTALPVTVILDPHGKIVRLHTGPMDAEELTQAIAAARS